jgi:hypothetical protein
MKLFLAIDATGDLARSEALDNIWYTFQKLISFFLYFDTLVEMALGLVEGLKECTFGARRDLTTHQDAELINFLPLIIESQQRANLEVAGSTVNSLGNLAPVVEIPNYLPIHVAVIDNEKFAASRASAIWHLE